MEKRGRKKITDENLKVKAAQAYMKLEDIKFINEKYGNLTKAVNKVILKK